MVPGNACAKLAIRGNSMMRRLLVRVGAEILRVIGKRLFHRVEHLGNVPGMLLQVIHLDADSIPIAARHFISGRDERIEVQ